MKNISILLAAATVTSTLLTLSPTMANAYDRVPDPNSGYEKCEYTDHNGNKLLYRMLPPAEVEDGVEYPLIVFLHGAGERGNDNEKQLTHGASMFTNPVNEVKFPAYVIFPQCKDKFWTGRMSAQDFMPGATEPEESATEKLVIDLIKDLTARYHIDHNRVYLMGISMGGVATYDLACRYPDIFAAAVPICGAVNPERLADAKDVKFMIFHGDSDEEVPLICGREAYKALNSAGAEVEYIEFAGEGHECWSAAFNYRELLPWLFSQSKPEEDPSKVSIAENR